MFRYKLFLSILIISLLPASSLAAPPASAVSEYTVMDFNDSVLHDASWRDSQQPAGTVMPYVAPKGDSGSNTLRLAVGQGRNGSNALEVVSNDSSQGLPGFWVIMGTPGGSNIGGYDGYILPRGRRANRLEYWVRFENGYRVAAAAAQPPAYPNHQNTHIGTYHHDPTGHDWARRLVETNNWHFYYQLFYRHDKAGGDWMRVVVHESPSHQRSERYPPNCNTTVPAGNFWEIATRFYIDAVPYFSDPEKAYPVRMWIDDIKLTYVPDPKEVSVDILNYLPGHSVVVATGVARDFPVLLKNNTSSAVTGRLSASAQWTLNPVLLDPGTGNPLADSITLAANESRTVTLQVNPDSSQSRYVGLSFVPNDQFQSDTTSVNRSFSEANLERRWQTEKGPWDGNMYCDHVHVATGTPPTNQAPEALGGVTCLVKSGETLSATLSGLDPENAALTYNVARQPTKGALNVQSNTGTFTYAPQAGFSGYDFFWFTVSDGSSTSAERVLWLTLGERTGCNLSPGDSGDTLAPAAPANLRTH